MGLCLEKLSTDLNIDTFQSLLCTVEYERTPLVSLEQAIQPLIPLIPNVETYAQMVKQKCVHPADELTSDQSASIMLSSIIWQPFDQCLYTLLNSTLQTLNQIKLQFWLFYLKLFFTALLNLPSNHFTVYRGSKSDLSEVYHVNDQIVWWDLSLCTRSIESLKSDQCLDQSNLRTIFLIECNTVKNIQKHCYREGNDFLLFLPATKFEVMECNYRTRENLYLIKLREIQPSFLLHSSDLMKSNLDTSVSLNIFQRLCVLFKQSGNDVSNLRDHYRNTILEQRIINNEHSWTVDLDRQNLTDRDMKIVVKYAIEKSHCKRIRLRDNHITSQGSSILSEGLNNNTILESLDLRNNQISDIGAQFLSLAIVYSNIKTLNLESNEITAEGAHYLAQMLKDTRSLAELYLSKNHLGDRGIELLANALSDQMTNTREQSHQAMHHSTLQHLYLGQNGITDEGVKHLATMLRTNRTLTWLWLTGNEISNIGIEYLANILADYNVTLEWLFLNSNKLISDPCIDDLIHMLKRNQTLKTLYLNNCNLSEITKRKLLQLIKAKKDFDLEV